tara:strand:- start:370 stop:1806 length:1437 start_codon:yes stop_codon:yes gene_type:complete
MANVIKNKRGTTKPSASDIVVGEIAVKTDDAKLYIENDSGYVFEVGETLGTFSSSTITYIVTVASKTAAHRYNGTGSSAGYKINGIFSPFLSLVPGNTYKFDQSDSSNSGHPLRFYLEADKTTAYTTNVTTNGTAGSSGAYTQIVVTDSTPIILHYQCSAHGYMGNSVTSNSNAISIVSDSSPDLGGDLQSNGNDIDFADNDKAIFGTDGDLQIRHDSSNSKITHSGSGGLYIGADTFALEKSDHSEIYISMSANGAVELYHDNTKRFETTSSGAKVSNGDLFLDDNQKIKLGDSNDLQIYHSSGENFIRGNASTSPLYIDCCENLNIRHLDTNGTNAETMIKAVADGAVELYYDNSKKLETTNTGVSVTGGLVASGDVTAFSDLRLKTDIHTIKDALDIVSNLRGVAYKWLNNGKSSIGVIAQEVEQVLPEIVTTNKDLIFDGAKDVKSIDYGKIVSVLINAINELKAELDEMKGGE